MQDGGGNFHARQAARKTRDDLAELLIIDEKISSCGKLSEDIEQFEESIGLVQQFIDQDDIKALSELLIDLN